MTPDEALTPRQEALCALLAGDPDYRPRYAVTQPGKPHKDDIWLELARRYAVHARHAHEENRCVSDRSPWSGSGPTKD